MSHLGNGKTHYIKTQLGKCCVLIAINEAFSTTNVLNSLNSLNDETEASIHINFTLLPPGVCHINISLYMIVYLYRAM